ncbi:MAG: chromosome segregation SMC family protein [Candidatus Pacearchaeota archaeon]
MTYIKKLVMQGFKSFPKKTEIIFSKGINVIVGPNGSGKSNISDAICFALGRLSMKSIRAAKAENLIFLGTKSTPPSKEAIVEIVLDNSEKTFSYESEEICIKRIVKKDGQSIYKINNETKNRYDVLNLLAQAGIDPYGFNIILQGEIQNFVTMQPEERRKIIEEVSGISVYEQQKEKALRELEKTEEKLKEINSILRERTNYLLNLEKERQQALKYKKLESDLKKLKASIISHDLHKKTKESEKANIEIIKKNEEIEKLKNTIFGLEEQIKNADSEAQKINIEIKKLTGVEQESLNTEIADLRVELAGLKTKIENYENQLSSLLNQKNNLKKTIEELEDFLSKIKKEPFSKEKKRDEINKKKRELEVLEEKRKKFYIWKSECLSLEERISDKKNLIQNYERDIKTINKQIEMISIEIVDEKADKNKLEKVRSLLKEKKALLGSLLKKEIELEKTISSNESEIELQKDMLEKILKLDICPLCKNRITPEHIGTIKKDVESKTILLKKEIENSNKELREIYQKKEVITNDIENLIQEISKIELDIAKLKSISEKRASLNILEEKIKETRKDVENMEKRREEILKLIEENSNIEEKYEILKIEMREILMMEKENIEPEIESKKREIEKLKIYLKQTNEKEEEIIKQKSAIINLINEKEKSFYEKKKQEEALKKRFEEILNKRDSIYSEIKKKESEVFTKRQEIRRLEEEVNEIRINKARIDAELKSLESEMSEFSGVEIIKASREILNQKLLKVQEDLSKIGNVNLRALEVYDAVKKEYDSIKQKLEVILKEKEEIGRVISEIDSKKKRVFFQTMKKINELMTRNFFQLSSKGEAFLEVENKDNPFEDKSGVYIVVKTGHGKYFDAKSLSGGEQTLLALSLIFAIQEYKPYYFYLFDEIDAALDKKNSERLAGLLNKYMVKGQYIIITHNDEVISRATNIYGVTMPGSDGVSKITSIKI